MAKSTSLSAETDKKILNKEKEIQKLDEKKQKLRNEVAELKKQQLRERNDGFGELLKKNNIDTNELAQLLRTNSEVRDMIQMFLAEQKPDKHEEVQSDTEPEEQAVTDKAEESYEQETDDKETESYDSYDDSDDDYIDFNS